MDPSKQSPAIASRGRNQPTGHGHKHALYVPFQIRPSFVRLQTTVAFLVQYVKELELVNPEIMTLPVPVNFKRMKKKSSLLKCRARDVRTSMVGA